MTGAAGVAAEAPAAEGANPQEIWPATTELWLKLPTDWMTS